MINILTHYLLHGGKHCAAVLQNFFQNNKLVHLVNGFYNIFILLEMSKCMKQGWIVFKDNGCMCINTK